MSLPHSTTPVDTFGYIETEIPAGMTLADYRRMRSTPRAGALASIRRHGHPHRSKRAGALAGSVA